MRPSKYFPAKISFEKETKLEKRRVIKSAQTLEKKREKRAPRVMTARIGMELMIREEKRGQAKSRPSLPL